MILRLIKWFIVLAGIVALTSFAFSLYANFLLDYSLEHLSLTIAAADDPQEVSFSNRSVYRTFLQDLVVEEAARENINFKNVAFLDRASHALEEEAGPAGAEKAKLYLRHVVQSKRMERSPILRGVDIFYVFFQRSSQFLLAFFGSFGNWLSPSKKESIEMSGLLLLHEAQEREKVWKLDEAEGLYLKFLELYPSHADRPFVVLSLAQVLIKEQKWSQAETLLRKEPFAFEDSKSQTLAAGLLQKIENLKKGDVRVVQLEELIPEQKDPATTERLQFKLALEHLHSYSLDEAVALFRQFEESKNETLRQRALYYRALIYKLRGQYDEGQKVLLKLLAEEDLAQELDLGSKAQLAGIYQRKRDVTESLHHYKSLSRDIEEQDITNRASAQAWKALAEVEQASIYYIDLGDAVQGQERLQRLEGVSGTEEFRQDFEMASTRNLRDLAFQALRNKQARLAEDIFKKNLTYFPRDAWSYAGLATVYVLIADMDKAQEYAGRAYQMGRDEYTASVQGYIQSFIGEHEEAIRAYREALGRNPVYIPARFNLAVAYLQTKRYQEGFELLTALDQTFKDVPGVMRSKILNNLGVALWWLGEQAQAQERFEEALEITPDFYDAKRNLDQVIGGGVPEVVPAPELVNAQG